MSEGSARPVFFVSDRTGITAETLGHTLLTQFEGVEFQQRTLPFVDTEERARQAVEEINRAAESEGVRPLVFSTLIVDELRDIVAGSQGVFFDFFNEFIGPLEEEFHLQSTHAIGLSHGASDEGRYMLRMDAVNFALETDDGVSTEHYDYADLILAGVSRCGKTPTCLYMALQFGIFAANYPLTEEDLDLPRLPDVLLEHRDKVFGLTIDAQRLAAIREARRPNSRYASLHQCRKELRKVTNLFRLEGIPVYDTSTSSIEEIATTILQTANIKRRLY
ncbi:MAG: pyruvate, water dikinase regulatory protein [Gammaproteobacteria bacterium]